MMNLKLGCPNYCESFTCVDIRQKDKRVIKQDVYEYLSFNKTKYDTIYSKNLLEHIPNVSTFINLCYDHINTSGSLEVITDNAEFLLFYFPFWIPHTGIGAHNKNQYAIDHCDSVHYSIFTKMHLINLFKLAGFRIIVCKRILFGSRLRIVGYK